MSSAYFDITLPDTTECRSDAVTTYEGGPIPEPCMMLADIVRDSDGRLEDVRFAQPQHRQRERIRILLT